MAITQEQVQQFRTQGYVLAHEFFDQREVHAMQAEVERLKETGALRNVTTEGDGKTTSQSNRNLQLCPTVRHSTLFRALPFENKVIEAVEQLIGSPIILHLDQVFLKPAGDGAGTNWHQDNAYFKIRDPLRGTAMWIAVHDATIENGTMEVIPEAFGDALPHERDPMSDHHIRCYPDESQAVPLEMKAGGVAFFCYGTPHCTRANLSAADRAGFAYHFLHVDYANDDLIADDRDYCPYLTGDKASGGEREYGQHVAGTFQDEVDKALGAAGAAKA